MAGKGVLGLPPLSWRAVGLTGKMGRWALTQNSRRCQVGKGERVQTKESRRGGGIHRNPDNTRDSPESQEEPPKRGAGEFHQLGCAPTWPYEVAGRPEIPPKAGYQICKTKQMCRQSCGCRQNHPGRDEPQIPSDNGGVDAERNCTRLEKLLFGGELEAHVAVLAAGEGERKQAEPPSTGRAEKSPHPHKRPKDEEDPEKRQEKPPGEGDSKKLADLNARVEYVPVCCSCSRHGAEALKHPGEVFVTSSFAVRPLRRGSSTNLGICLMANRAGSVTSTKGRLCGHLVCPNCTVLKNDQLMRPCCLARLEAQGAAKGGAGPLPPKQRSPSPAHVDSPEPRRSLSRDSRGDSDRRSMREGASPRRERAPEPAYPPSGKRTQHPDHSGDERRPAKRARQEICVIKGCDRDAREDRNTCCEVCSRTGGQRHSRYCDSRHGLGPPPRDRDDDDDDFYDHDDDEEEDKGRGKKGKGKGKKGHWKWVDKRSGKAARDRDRWNAWNKAGRQKKGVWSVSLFNAALKMGQAPNTRKSTASRLTTWDRAMEELERKEILEESRDRIHMTPNRLKAGVAYLKARGYRSAELYMSAALKRHRGLFGQDPMLGEAAKEAVRVARRGRGPPAGKQPVPVPAPHAPLYEAILTGIWFLLRADELVNLNVGDAWRRQGGPRVQVALVIRQSKTDQEAQGELVTRDCTCSESPNDRCPAHVIWDQVTDRLITGKRLGADMSQAPLFVGPTGDRLSKGRGGGSSEGGGLSCRGASPMQRAEPLRDAFDACGWGPPCFLCKRGRRNGQSIGEVEDNSGDDGLPEGHAGYQSSKRHCTHGADHGRR